MLDGREAEYVADAIKSGWISSAGDYLNRFETAFADYCGVEHAVSVANGTAALQVAIRALKLPRGSQVILPSFTIVSCALAVVDSGCVPVFVDVEAETWNLDVDQVTAAISENTSAVLAVHMYGHPASIDEIRQVIGDRPVFLVEDAAQAHGGRYHDRPCGSLGDIATFSFYANKLITTGEGGMVVTDDDNKAERCRSLRNLCHRPGHRFTHDELGWNFRFTNVQAAIGLAQLERADAHLEKRRRNAARYSERLSAIDGLTLPVERPGIRNTFWMYAIVLDSDLGVDAVEMGRRLGEHGIQTRTFFQPLHRQKPFLEYASLRPTDQLPVTERIAKYGLYLPSGIGLDRTTIERVCDNFRECLPEAGS